jgi:hypothetical protein
VGAAREIEIVAAPLAVPAHVPWSLTEEMLYVVC